MTDLTELATEGGGRYRPMSTKTPAMFTDASSADRDCICSVAVCLPVYPSDLGLFPHYVARNAVGSRPVHRDGGVVRHGAKRRAALRALPSDAESGAVAVAAGRADAAQASFARFVDCPAQDFGEDV